MGIGGVGSVPQAEMCPRVVKWNFISSSWGRSILLMVWKEVDLKDDESVAKGLPQGILLSDRIHILCEIEEGRVSDFKDRKERAILHYWSAKRRGVGWRGHIQKGLSEVEKSVGVIIPTRKATSQGGAIVNDCFYEEIVRFVIAIATVSEREIVFQPRFQRGLP
jgi:hypothetical protein